MIQPVQALEGLDLGEQSAILLAEQLEADLLLINEMIGRQIAQSRGLQVIGVLGILEEAGRLRWIDLPVVLEQLQQTTLFRVSKQLIQQMLERYRFRG